MHGVIHGVTARGRNDMGKLVDPRCSTKAVLICIGRDADCRNAYACVSTTDRNKNNPPRA